MGELAAKPFAGGRAGGQTFFSHSKRPHPLDLLDLISNPASTQSKVDDSTNTSKEQEGEKRVRGAHLELPPLPISPYPVSVFDSIELI